MSKKIQDRNWLYAFLRRIWVDITIRRAYRRMEYVGLEKVPKDGAIIYAPNHTNALMDALVVLNMDHSQKVFVARADIFKNRTLAKLLRFLKIMPIMRSRDGMEEVRKNTETIHKSVDVLMDRIPFCILPEGRHQAMHSLLPLSKGIFRIAMEADSLMDGKMPLYIVPLGLEYGNFFRFRSSILLQVGDPINVSAFLQDHKDLTPAEFMNRMKDILTGRMRDIILYVPDDEYYEATMDACAAVMSTKPSSQRRSLMERFRINKQTLQQIAELRAQDPLKAEEVLGKADEVYRERRRRNISRNSVAQHNPYSRLLKFPIFLATLPYTLSAAVLGLPVTGISALLFKLLKDRAFYNSIRFVVNLVLWPLMVLIYGSVLFATCPWEWATGITIGLMPATTLSHEAYRYLRLTISDLKYLSSRKLRGLVRELRSTL